MSKQRKTASAMSVCQYLAAGVTGTAMVGVGVLLTVPPDKPAPTTAEVKLANTEAECVPDTPGCDSAALGASLGVDSFATPGTTAIFFGAIGSGGWLIGDGLSWDEIDATCTELCNGGNGGLFGGSGGDGAYGGTGGNAGFFWGSGGDGGDGLDAVYGDDPATPGVVDIVKLSAATPGGAGGNASFLFGNGGPGGDGGWDQNLTGAPVLGGTDISAFAGHGGIGGRGGLLFGDGGTGGDGGQAESPIAGTAVAGNGGQGGDSGLFLGNGGDGGWGGFAEALEVGTDEFSQTAFGGFGGGGGDGALLIGDGGTGGTGGDAVAPFGTATGGTGGLGGDARVGDGGDGG